MYEGDTGRVAARGVLAGGRLFATIDEATAAGARPGQLGNFSGAENLRGGQPGALTGSTDGWLYAVLPCADPVTLAWAVDFDWAVGEPVIADADGDGRNDVVASVADGFLYGVGDEILPPPGNVRDVEPSADVDVDWIEAIDTLHARWDPVPGASTYEYVVVDGEGMPLADPPPPYVDVGSATEATATLALALDAAYRFAVRAVGPRGAGVEGFSDGVTIRDGAAPDVLLEAAPPVITPDADGIDDATRVSWSAAEERSLATHRLGVFDAAGGLLRMLAEGPLEGTAAAGEEDWDGRDDSGAMLPPGDYLIRLSVADTAGNIGPGEVTVTIAAAPGPDAGGDAEDTGDSVTDAGDADTDGAIEDGDAGTSADDGGADTGPAEAGCGCRAAVPTPRGMLLLLALVVARRTLARSRRLRVDRGATRAARRRPLPPPDPGGTRLHLLAPPRQGHDRDV